LALGKPRLNSSNEVFGLALKDFPTLRYVRCGNSEFDIVALDWLASLNNNHESSGLLRSSLMFGLVLKLCPPGTGGGGSARQGNVAYDVAHMT
jgi:hypothetical protein